jgi:hypothetical protein
LPPAGGSAFTPSRAARTGHARRHTGAWIQPDERPLSPELEAFLDAGEPPVYFGFDSNRAPEGLSQVMVHTARALGRRAIISQGWAELFVVTNMANHPDSGGLC